MYIAVGMVVVIKASLPSSNVERIILCCICTCIQLKVCMTEILTISEDVSSNDLGRHLDTCQVVIVKDDDLLRSLSLNISHPLTRLAT